MSPHTMPVIRHCCSGRLRLHWTGLRHPALRADYLEAWLAQRAGLLQVRANVAGACLVAEFDERPGVFEAIALALSQIPAEAYAQKCLDHLPTPRRLADALFHSALAAGGMLLPPRPRLGLAAVMGAPVLLRGAETLFNRGLRAKTLDMATVGFALATGEASSALGISAMVMVGEYLRQATEDRAGALLRSLLAPPVENVRVERALAGTGQNVPPQEAVVAFAEVQPGDIVLVAAGEVVPVDGLVERGTALVDKSAITGEATPMEVAPGDVMLAGSVLAHGSLALRAVRTGPECTTARIAALMNKCLRDKSRPERLSDRLADRLAPLTLLLGAGLWAATGDSRRALAVLTIDYACAVKLSAPVVVKSSMYAAARAGVLVKSGSALDELAQADTVVFDKTGTLTTGRLAVADVLVLPGLGLDEDELLALAASAEERWTHPVARALVDEALRRGLTLLPAWGTQCATALGVRALVGWGKVHREVLVGSLLFLEQACGVAGYCGQEGLLRAEGKVLVHVALDGRPVGVIALRDELRPEAGAVITALRERGVQRVVLLTGDHEAAARAIFCSQIGAAAPDEIQAGLSPEDKAQVVRQLRLAGARVAVVGDGINDAPALLAASVGVCVAGDALPGGGVAGLTRDSACIVLLRPGLWGLVAVRDIAARAARILKSCFGTGVAVNSGLLLMAGAGKLSPLVAAALHNGTTFAILGGAALRAGATLPSSEKSTAGS